MNKYEILYRTETIVFDEHDIPHRMTEHNITTIYGSDETDVKSVFYKHHPFSVLFSSDTRHFIEEIRKMEG